MYDLTCSSVSLSIFTINYTMQWYTWMEADTACSFSFYELIVAEKIVLAEELRVLDGDSPLWRPARPLLDAALRLEQNNATYSWHGWNKQQITTFLDRLSPRCSLVVGVWETVPGEAGMPEREELALCVLPDGWWPRWPGRCSWRKRPGMSGFLPAGMMAR